MNHVNLRRVLFAFVYLGFVSSPVFADSSAPRVDLEKLWKIGGLSESPDELFGVIVDLAVDDNGFVYLLDLQLAEVKVFSPSGEYVRTIARMGDGPGEFRSPRKLFITDDNKLCVMQPSPARMSVFELNGRYVGEWELPSVADGGFQAVTHVKQRNGVVVIQGMNVQMGEGYMDQVSWIGAFAEGRLGTTRLGESKRHIDFAKPVVRETDTEGLQWKLGPNGRVYINDGYNYQITVKTLDGVVEKEISRDYEHRKRSQRELEKIHAYYTSSGGGQGVQLEIMKHNRDIEWFDVACNGEVWVLTSRGLDSSTAEGVLGVFDLFTSGGDFAKEVTLGGDGDLGNDQCYLVGDRIYLVTEFKESFKSWRNQAGATIVDDDGDVGPTEEIEPMAVVCYQLPSSVLH